MAWVGRKDHQRINQHNLQYQRLIQLLISQCDICHLSSAMLHYIHIGQTGQTLHEGSRWIQNRHWKQKYPEMSRWIFCPSWTLSLSLSLFPSLSLSLPLWPQSCSTWIIKLEGQIPKGSYQASTHQEVQHTPSRYKQRQWPPIYVVNMNQTTCAFVKPYYCDGIN